MHWETAPVLAKVASVLSPRPRVLASLGQNRGRVAKPSSVGRLVGQQAAGDSWQSAAPPSPAAAPPVAFLLSHCNSDQRLD